MSFNGKVLCVLFSGKAGVGKTTSANILYKIMSKNNLEVEIGSFAIGVKSTALHMGWDGEKDAKGRKLLIDIGMAGREYN